MTQNKDFNRFSILSFVLMGLSALYTLLLVSFHGDISIFAFILAVIYAGIVFYFLGIEILKKTNGKHILTANRLIEFMPYIFFVSFILRRAGNTGTPFWYDLITVILWFSIFVLSIIVSHKLDSKHNKNIVKDWAIPPVEMNYKGVARVIYEIGDWVYAIIWAIFSVLILQIFVVQLYEIPSESMVPTFLIKDRVFVSKIDCGPKFPLTDVGLPTFRKYEKGDTVVLRNPHYSMDRKSEVKTVTSQLVYMLTFMTVNLNTDEYGQMKADPLVKRITGVPGEQLVMQDGVLYARTEGNDDFIPSETDAKYATWNLNECPPDVKRKIRTMVLSPSSYEAMLDFEEKRRNFDLNVASYEASNIVNDVKRLVEVYSASFNNSSYLSESFVVPEMKAIDLFRSVDEIALNILTQNGGVEWFTSFMTSWINSKDIEKDMYSESNYKINVMAKMLLGNIILKKCQAYSGHDLGVLGDTDIIRNMEEANILLNYLILLDSRNMPVFPSNDSNGNPQYLPKDCYFMMGDNRFNSLDLRHDSEIHEKPLTSYDNMSVTYDSMMKPQYINKKFIIGKPMFRFWPFDRFGKV